MVLVAVGNENAQDLTLVFNKVADVRNNHVDAVHVIVWESHAAVYNNNVVAILVNSQVLADLIETAQRNNFQFFSHNNSFSNNKAK